MQVASGTGPDSQWFDYRTTFFGDTMRVEWDKGTMFAALAVILGGFAYALGSWGGAQ